jgi:hypothetical protein
MSSLFPDADELLEHPPIDVRDQVEEAIDAEGLAVERPSSSVGRWMSRRWMAPAGRPSAARSTPFARSSVRS